MIISITPAGNLGNRMLAYMTALALARRWPGGAAINCDLPEFGLVFDGVLHARLQAGGAFVAFDRETDGIPALAGRIRASGAASVVMDGFFQRFGLYEPAEFYRDTIFPIAPLDIEPFAGDELVINIRAAEILGGQIYWYPLVPVGFYADLVARTGLRPVFLGQIEECAYLRELQAALPEARIVPSGGALVDFNRLRHARHLCITVSTFSWLAAWLSGARTIHYPLLGFLHPFCLPKGTHELGGVDLTPLGDARYRYHLLPILHAEPEASFLPFTRSLRPISMAVSEDLVAGLQARRDARPEAVELYTYRTRFYFRNHPDAAWAVSLGHYLGVEDHRRRVGNAHGYSLAAVPAVRRDGLPNLALGQPATQSSVSPWSHRPLPEEDASGAVDGRIDGGYGFHTSEEDDPWWRVDLGQSCAIGEIRVFNRIDNALVAARANRIVVELGESETDYREVLRRESGTPFGGADGAPLIVRPETQTIARYVRLRLPGRGCLHLDQVEVYGVPSGQRGEG